MTDRELLEKAARAIHLVVESYTENMNCWAYLQGAPANRDGEYPIFIWNPLDDDGDALRLAVNLGIDVTYKAFGEDEVMVSASDDQFDGWFTEPYGDDKAAATRRAIVRAAAEMADAPGAA